MYYLVTIIKQNFINISQQLYIHSMDRPYENLDEKIEEFQKQKITSGKAFGVMLGSIVNNILKQYNTTVYKNNDLPLFQSHY